MTYSIKTTEYRDGKPVTQTYGKYDDKYDAMIEQNIYNMGHDYSSAEIITIN